MQLPQQQQPDLSAEQAIYDALVAYLTKFNASCNDELAPWRRAFVSSFVTPNVDKFVELCANLPKATCASPAVAAVQDQDKNEANDAKFGAWPKDVDAVKALCERWHKYRHVWAYHPDHLLKKRDLKLARLAGKLAMAFFDHVSRAHPDAKGRWKAILSDLRDKHDWSIDGTPFKCEEVFTGMTTYVEPHTADTADTADTAVITITMCMFIRIFFEIEKFGPEDQKPQLAELKQALLEKLN